MPKVEAARAAIEASLGTTGSKPIDEVLRVFEAQAKQSSIVFRHRTQPDDPDIHVVSLCFDDKPGNCDDVAVINMSKVAVIYYTPFPCMFSQVEGLFQAKAGYAVEKHGAGDKPLAKYGAHAIFYVVCHGDKTAGEATCDCGKCGDKSNIGGGLIAYELWERLVNDGLPQNPTAIRLWACLGADPPAGDPTGSSFAATFALVAGFGNRDGTFLTDRTTFQSYKGYLTLTESGGYSYTARGDDTTRLEAGKRLVTVKRP
jgi:hypothetical protein